MNKNTLIVNFYGGPGSGKSTTAARIFSELKDLSYNVELTTEFAKDLTWEKSFHVLDNQLYVFAKQQHRIWRLDGKVDMILTDAALLNSIVYGENETSEAFKQLVIEEFQKRPSVNIFLKRVKKYNPIGRSQSEDEAKQLDNLFMDRVNKVTPFDLILNGEKASTQTITEHIIEQYNKINKYGNI